MRAEAPLGRDHELERVDRFLDGVPAGPCAFTITGPAGIGKTTVWHAGVEHAAARAFLTLTTRPSEAEARLSYAAIADLLTPVEASVIEALPPVQRRAIDVALLRAELGTEGNDARVVGAGILSALGSLASRQPVMLCVDDAQWLDTASSEALAFVVRRLGALRVGVLASVRVEGLRPDTFETSMPAASRLELQLSPLNAAALHAILKRRLDVVFPRPTLVRIVEASRGNPFYAVEIARELHRMGVTAPGHNLPVPGLLRSLITARLGRLPGRTREALLMAACLSQPTSALVDIEDLAPAEAAGIVDVDESGRIRFDHPLLAAAVYDSVPLAQRLRAHRRLAGMVRDPEERALHLAQATTVPDEEVATVLESAAQHASERGSKRTAVRLARRAIELSPDPHGAAAIRRIAAAADYEDLAGENPGEIRRLIESALAGCDDTELRARLLFHLGVTDSNDARLEQARVSYEKALELARDPRLRARIHVTMVWALDKDKRAAIAACDAALKEVSEAEDPVLYGQAWLMGAYLRLVVGEGADPGLERWSDRVIDGNWLGAVALAWPAMHDDLAKGSERYAKAIEQCRELGDEHSEHALMATVAEIELWLGNWDRADAYASAAQELAERSGSPRFLFSALYSRGYVDAHLGRLDAARETAARIGATAADLGDFAVAEGDRILGFIALSLRDYVQAAAHLTKAARVLEARQEWEPARYRFHPDLVEALVMTGDLTGAEKLVDWFDARGRIFPRPWIFAMAARCRGLLLAARGDLETATDCMRDALRHHECLPMPFERARTQLAFGRLLRRRNERREAREHTGAALAEFERLGAPLWAEQARSELARVPVRRAPAELTATEEKIARLVASGLTNREVAERAFVSPKTVEANLARVYDKLGVHSRAELGRVMADRAANR